VVIDGDGLKFNCLTKPYGFVPTDTKIWFKEFEDTDDFGNKEVREYLMCEGYLWTEQYEEAKKVINEGRPHSMELDKNSLKGYWSEDNNKGIEFFIVNDAIFSKLCILGEDVEPCFEGSSVTSPDISASFSLDTKQFTKTLYSMMKELQTFTYSLKQQGGESMKSQEVKDIIPTENFSKEQGKNDSTISSENNNITGEFKKEEEDKKEPEKKEDSNSGEDEGKEKESSKSEDKKEDEGEDEKKKPATKNSLEAEDKYSVLESKFNELSAKYSDLEQQNKELLAFKNAAEDKEKDALIAQFYMLSEEDKKEVIENKSKYSLDDIEAKLSVICVRKKVTFDNNESAKKEEAPTTTFNLNSLEGNDDGLPAWLKQVENHRKNNI